jgi:hypothetical protein
MSWVFVTWVQSQTTGLCDIIPTVELPEAQLPGVATDIPCPVVDKKKALVKIYQRFFLSNIWY